MECSFSGGAVKNFKRIRQDDEEEGLNLLKMIEIYKTNIEKRKTAKRVRKVLRQRFPNLLIDFDLEDCDKILRVENPEGNFDADLILDQVLKMGFFIDVLADKPMVGTPPFPNLAPVGKINM